MKVTKERAIQVLHASLVKIAKMSEPTTANQKEWVDEVLQPLDDLIFDHYVEFTPPEPPDDVVLKEVASAFTLKTGPWHELLNRLDARIKRLYKLLSIDAPRVITEDTLESISRTLDMIRERVESE